MERSGIEERRGARTEAARFVEIVEADNPVLLGGGFLDEEAHGDTHPKELRSLETAGLFLGFINDEVAIVEGLDAEVVEIHIRRGIDGIGQDIEVVAEKFGREAFDRNTSAQVVFEGFAVCIAEALDAIAGDAPLENFLVDIREENPGRKLGKIRVAFDESAGVEDDRIFKDVLGDLAANGAAEFALDLGGVEIEVEPDHGKLDSLFQLRAIPENIFAIALGDHDEGILDITGGGLGFGFCVLGAVTGALGAVKNVALGDLVISLPHQFLLDQILNIFDVNECRLTNADSL